MAETARLERRKVEELGGRCALQRRKDRQAILRGGAK